MDPDPIFRDLAASMLDQFSFESIEVRHARERSLARSLHLTAEAEVADLRAAEARRVIVRIAEEEC